VLYANSIGILSPFAILLTEWAVGYRDGVAAGELAAMAACAAGVALIFSHATRPTRTAAVPPAGAATDPPAGPPAR
jgi:hypothetical protein